MTMTHYNSGDNRSLSEVITGTMTSGELDEILQQADAAGLQGQELYQSLVLSGAALGITKVQLHAINFMSGHIQYMRRIQGILDDKLKEAAGDDEMTRFVTELREPLLESLRDHLSIVKGGHAEHHAGHLGIEPGLFLSELPVDAIDFKTLCIAGSAASFKTSMSFFGFILAGDNIPKMECSCVNHLAGVFRNKPQDADDVISQAIAKFGSMDQALVAYAKHLITHVRKELAEFESEYGNLDRVDHASEEITSTVLSRFFAGGAKE